MWGPLEDLGDKIVDAGEDLVEQGQQFVETVARRADDGFHAIVEDTEEAVADILEHPAEGLLWFGAGLPIEYALDAWSGTALTPWDQEMADSAAESSDRVQAGVDWFLNDYLGGLENLPNRSREMLLSYLPNPLLMADRILQDQLPGYASMRREFEEDLEESNAAIVLRGLTIYLRTITEAPKFLLTALGNFVRCRLHNELFNRLEQSTVIEAITAGGEALPPGVHVQRLQAAGRYFITSDLHRYSYGDFDAPELQKTKEIYEYLLNHYCIQGFSVIENGDTEDYWLEGGSLYGHAFGLSSGFSTPTGEAVEIDMLEQASELHLDEVCLNNQGIYRVLRQLHDAGAYYRTCGNHDDVYASPVMMAALRRYFPEIEVPDYIAMDGPEGCVGLIHHGHQTDTWNEEPCAFLGREITALWSLGRDLGLSFIPALRDIGDTRDLLRAGGNELTDTHPLFGFNAEFGSLNEVSAFHAYQVVFGHVTPDNTTSIGGRPILLMGHTHDPRVGPWHSGHRACWASYHNSGCGIFRRMVTGVEWDGTSNPSSPSTTNVAWYEENGVLRRFVLQPIGGQPWKIQGVWDGVNHPTQ